MQDIDIITKFSVNGNKKIYPHYEQHFYNEWSQLLNAHQS